MYEGRRGKRKRLFFIIQAVYPLVQGCVLFYCILHFLDLLKFKQDLYDDMQADWNKQDTNLVRISLG